jgi:hypothetical protein
VLAGEPEIGIALVVKTSAPPGGAPADERLSVESSSRVLQGGTLLVLGAAALREK